MSMPDPSRSKIACFLAVHVTSIPPLPMKQKAPTSSQSRIKGITYQHYGTNKRGKTVAVKRPRVEALSSRIVPLPRQPFSNLINHTDNLPYDDGDEFWEDVDTGPRIPNIDDLGHEDSPEFPSKMVRAT